MALFIAYAILSSAVIFLVCHLVDACVSAFGLSTRMVWVAGIALASLLPVSMAVRVDAPPTIAPAVTSATHVQVSTQITPQTAIPTAPSLKQRFYGKLDSLDGLLVNLWLLGSFLALTVVMALAFQTKRVVSATTRTELHGIGVRRSQQLGPALVGIVSYEIVLPRWVFELPSDQQLLILRHEQEHARARDPLLVWLTAISVVLVPWNVPLWHLLRRLRTSIEIDCDRRVLEVVPEPVVYGSLLLDISSKNSSQHFYTAAFGESGSQLHRRIRAMSSTHRPMARTIGVLSAGAAVILLAAAFRAPRPHAPQVSAVLKENFGVSSKVVATRATKREERNTASVAVSMKGRMRDFLVYTTGGARVGVAGASPVAIPDTIQLHANISLTADLTDGEVHIVSVGGWPVEVSATFFHSPAVQASATWRHVVLNKGGNGVSFANTVVTAPKRVLTLTDSVTKLAMQFEPAAFDRKANPSSSVIGLLVGTDGNIMHHSRITVGNDEETLLDLMPRLFSDLEQTKKAPLRIFTLLDGVYGQRNIQVVVVFLKKPPMPGGGNRGE